MSNNSNDSEVQKKGSIIEKLRRFLFGDDIFISYSRVDSTYALALANELTKRNLSCFLDQYGTPPGEELPKELINTIKRCSTMVLVGSKSAAGSDNVGIEVKEFVKTGRPIIPITFLSDSLIPDITENSDRQNLIGTLEQAKWYSIIAGIAKTTETLSALKTRTPSENILLRIVNATEFRSRSKRLRKTFFATLGTISILILLGTIVIIGLSNQAKAEKTKADEATNAAINANIEAEQATNRANFATNLAKQKEDLANVETQKAINANIEAKEQTEISANKTKIAEDATKLADEKNKLAREKTLLANQKTAEAKKAVAETQKAKSETKEQKKIAGKLKEQNRKEESRKLALGAQIELDREPNSLFRVALLANEAMTRDHSIEADSILRKSLSLIPQPISVLYKGLDVRKSAFDSMGKYAAAVDSLNIYDGTGGKFIIWDSKDWKEIKSLSQEEVSNFQFDPNGKYLALLKFKGELIIYHLSTFEIVWSKSIPPKSDEIHISPNGEKIAVSGGTWADGSTVKIFNSSNGYSFPDASTPKNETFSSLSFSKDGELIKTTTNKEIRILKVTDSKEIKQISDISETNSIDYYFGCLLEEEFPQWAITENYNDNCERFKIKDDEGNNIARRILSPTGNYALLYVENGIGIRRGDESGFNEEIARLPISFHASDVIFSPDESMILTTTDDGTVRLWETESGKEISRIPWKENINIDEAVDASNVFKSSAFSPDGKLLLINLIKSRDYINKNTDSSFYLFNIQPLKLSTQSEFPKAYDCMALSADGNFVAFAGGHDVNQEYRVPERSVVQVVELSSGKVKNLYLGDIDEMDSDVRVESLALSSDGRYVAIGGDDGKIRFWNWINDKDVKIKNHSDSNVIVENLAFSYNDQYLTSAGDNTIKIWNLSEEKDAPKIIYDDFERIEFNSNKTKFLTTNSDKAITVWKIPTGEKMPKFSSFQIGAEILDAKFSPQKNLIAIASTDGFVRIWNIETGKKEFERKYEEIDDEFSKQGIDRISFSKQGDLLAGISGDGRDGTNPNVIIWEITSGKIVNQIAHPYVVLDVNFSPDGENLVSISLDGILRTWNVLKGNELSRINVKFESQKIDFSNDGKYIITPGEFHLWRSDDLIKAARSVFIRSLTLIEKDDYFLK